jgi:parallel beta-helix repeat protein
MAFALSLSSAGPASASPDGLVAHWRFNEGSGSIAHDESPNNNDGTIYGATWVDGIFGKALSFDGNDYVRVPDSSTFKPDNSLTIVAWVKPEATQDDYASIVSLDYRADGTWDPPFVAYELGASCGMGNSRRPWFRGWEGFYVTSPDALTPDEWHLVVGTFDGSIARLYVDGELKESENYTGLIDYGTSKDLVIGQRSPYSPDQFFKGLIDEVRIYNRGLTQSEISNLYRRPHDPIYIYGNDNFTENNGVVGGSGAENDPYIIENWIISAENANGIEIRNTTAHFVIRNCMVENGGWTYRGIYLYNLTNGKIGSCAFSNNHGGIDMWDSDRNIIKNCVFEKSFWESEDNDYNGIELRSAEHNIISNCIIENSKGIGVVLYESDNNLIKNCAIRNNYWHGIEFWSGSENNTVENCMIENNKHCGVVVGYCGKNIIRESISENNSRHGILLTHSDNCIVSNNISKNNDWTGIRLNYSDNNTLFYNISENNSNYGIYLNDSNNNYAYHNISVNNRKTSFDNGSNYWDNGYPSGGNYWSDYTGEDNYQGENQDVPGSDG